MQKQNINALKERQEDIKKLTRENQKLTAALENYRLRLNHLDSKLFNLEKDNSSLFIDNAATSSEAKPSLIKDYAAKFNEALNKD